ncbi:MAG: hypothetical protein ABJC13_18900 [Acidobacteriota bacterium]
MPFGSLWLPVVVSAIAVWIVSAILHMVLKYHRADYKRLSNEDGIASAIRGVAPSPGIYPIPYCTDGKQMKDPAFQKKYTDGPVGLLTVMKNGPPAMGKYLGQWLGFCLLASVVTAYVARHTLSPGTDPLEVLRITGAVSFAAYGFSSLQAGIWKGEPLGNVIRGFIDGLIYGVTTGLVFRLLWPAA